jgi:hypothetical protein|tara:strand:+ start:1441 stop:1575 length:135 start_codon:yes stop_codon:yes gene_type:complete
MIIFTKSISATGTSETEMRINGIPWGRFKTEADGIAWAKSNSLI